MSENTNSKLTPYRVMVRGEESDELPWPFDCMAEDEDHAVEQAQDASPGCAIASVVPFDESPLAYVIYSPNESAVMSGAGFWSHEFGWEIFDHVSRFSYQETQTFKLPLSIGHDTRWVLWEGANAGYGGPPAETVRVRLTFDITYSLNGERATEMVDRLRNMCERAIGEGMLTGESAAEVDEYAMDAVVLPEPLSEDALTDFLRQRVENGDLALDDLPLRLARYGLMEPAAFVDEMRERMASAQGS
ncbi:hypothetical protein [Verminephrobacter eiseniae]|uniref:hypothetical protein n=1 Tax=Verminephrobacter eiseniae TaxID=364317 RepID=UPI002236F74B|nr:hypothetical protein [Verminephrobacter eiseniae]